MPTQFAARLTVHIPAAAAGTSTTTGPRYVVVVSPDLGPMAHTLVAAAGPSSTTGPRCVVAVLSDPGPMAHTLAVVVPRPTTTGFPSVAGTGC